MQRPKSRARGAARTRGAPQSDVDRQVKKVVRVLSGLGAARAWLGARTSGARGARIRTAGRAKADRLTNAPANEAIVVRGWVVRRVGSVADGECVRCVVAEARELWSCWDGAFTSSAAFCFSLPPRADRQPAASLSRGRQDANDTDGRLNTEDLRKKREGNTREGGGAGGQRSATRLRKKNQNTKKNRRTKKKNERERGGPDRKKKEKHREEGPSPSKRHPAQGYLVDQVEPGAHTADERDT